MKKDTLTYCLFLSIFLAFPFQSCQKAKEVRNDLLEYSLNTLGEKLFSLMGESPEKAQLQDKYNSFVERAADGEANQDQIEYVAANIMNASNSQETVNPELAAQILETTEPNFQPSKALNQDTPIRTAALTNEESMAIGENLSNLIKMNENLKDSFFKHGSQSDFSKKVFYKWDKGIVLNLDEELKSEKDQEEFKFIFAQLEDLEKVQKMEWKKELSKALKSEHVKYKMEMKKLKELHMNHQEIPGMEAIEIFTIADSNFFSPYIPDVNIDSIMEAVEASLESAGISKKVIIQK